MDEILDEVKALDIKVLREKLLENGVKVGPIAQSSISLFQKRLASEIFRQRGGVREEQSTEDAEPVKEVERDVSQKRENSSSNGTGVYYAVCLPENIEQDKTDTGDQLVFSDKDLALKTAKKYTGSRFKVFKSEQDAKVFSRLTAESAFQSPRRPSKEDTPVKETGAPSSESSPYKGPKPQDLAKLRKVIESGDVDTFRQQVWSNPRFLVSSGDTPAMYQEGPRYTAMHVAAVKNKHEVCQAILDILENPEFVNKLYCQSKHTEETLNSRINFLVDLYLNMPDKGSCESPLHMACKFGNEKVVEVLAAHPLTDKQLKNKWGDTPKAASLWTRPFVIIPRRRPRDIVLAVSVRPESYLGNRSKYIFGGGYQFIEFAWLIQKYFTMSTGQNSRKQSPRVVDKHLICSRCPNPSQTLKKKIEELLLGQCYVPLMRSEDNTVAPLIGQPWSPDLTKSTEMPRIAHSPRDPSMSVRACAGPMSPTDAGLFHKRWTTPPSISQGPDQAKAYFNIKRSDCEKGMERIGRKLANELHIQWSEYWEFLDQFVDLSSTAGLDMLEYYLKKRVWLTFVKDFKDKFGIAEQMADFTSLSTPVTNRTRQTLEKDADKSVNSMFTTDVVDNKEEGTSCNSKTVSDKTEERHGENSDICDRRNNNEKQSANNVLSPMSELSHCFANMKMDDSWSERATIDSSEKSLANDGKNDMVDASAPTDNPNIVEGRCSSELEIDNTNDLIKKDIPNADDKVDNNNETTKKDIPNADDQPSEPEKTEERSDNLRDSKEKDTDDTKTADDKAVQRLVSVESESTGSYETAAEDVSDGEHTFCSQLSEPGNIEVVIRLKDSAILTKLTDYVSACELHLVVNFVVQVKNYASNSGMKVNIISVPEIENIHKLFLLEDIDVAGCDGDLSTVQEGEVVELGTSCSGQDGYQSVMAYLTRAVTLPKAKYIYGPQPTREDLNVSHALTEVTISPELHPHVFHWKINLSRFLRDTNYRWQSPAKLQSRLRQGSPQPSPLGKASPVTQYGSPLSGRGQPTNVIPSDIRTKLFPSIME